MIPNVQLPRTVSQAIFTVGALILLVLPLLSPSPYYVNLGIDVLFIFLFALSFNLLFGYTGLLSFGQAAFFGLGAYMVPLLLRGEAFMPAIESFLLVIVIAVIAAALLGAVIGFLSIRRGGIYFAMLTLAFSMMIYEGAFRWRSLTSGDDGIITPTPTIELGVASLSLGDHIIYYYFTLLIVAVATFLVWRVTKSPFGEILVLIRENEERTEFIGVNVTLYKWASFTLSAALAGLAGAIAAAHLLVISPGTLHWTRSAEPVLITLIGGPTYFFGPLVGTIVFVALEQSLTAVTDHWEVFAGLVLIVIVLFTPNGVLGLWHERVEPRVTDAVERILEDS